MTQHQQHQRLTHHFAHHQQYQQQQQQHHHHQQQQHQHYHHHHQQQQQQQQQQQEKTKSLMTLVDVASSLFDRAQSDSGRQQTTIIYPQPPIMNIVKKNPKQINNIFPANINTNIANINTNTNHHCCTREGFLQKLKLVLDDPLERYSDSLLRWMPNGESFTIVSSRKFAKSGQVFELFGIRKMSSFLRRLNQLDFKRIRDQTDPTNLDIFQRRNFMSSTKLQQHLEQERRDDDCSRRSATPTNSPPPPRMVTSVSESSSSSSSSESSSSVSSSTSTTMAWVYLTPEQQQQQRQRQHADLPPIVACATNIRLLPPLMPHPPFSTTSNTSPSSATTSLRARSQGYESETSSLSSSSYNTPSIVSNPSFTSSSSSSLSQLSPLPRGSAIAVATVSASTSPNTFRLLKVPSMDHHLDESRAATTTIKAVVDDDRPLPIEFVAEYVRQLKEYQHTQIDIQEQEQEAEVKDTMMRYDNDDEQRDNNSTIIVNNSLPIKKRPYRHSRTISMDLDTTTQDEDDELLRQLIIQESDAEADRYLDNVTSVTEEEETATNALVMAVDADSDSDECTYKEEVLTIIAADIERIERHHRVRREHQQHQHHQMQQQHIRSVVAPS